MGNEVAERIDAMPFLFDHPTVRDDIDRVLAADLPWHLLNDRTVLVSGASGMLPAAMVDVLMAARTSPRKLDVKVIALARSRVRAERRFHRWLGSDGFSLLVQDVNEPLAINAPVQLIVHAASQASPKYYGSDPVGTILPNVTGTANLLQLARKNAAQRFLFFSSAEVYGRFTDQRPNIDEAMFGALDPVDNRSCYGESKRLGEALCAAYSRQYGVPAVMVRPFHTYGPGMKLDDGRAFADFVRDIVSNRDIVLNSTGAARRCFCYLADATEAYLKVLLTGEPGTAYNVANPLASTSMVELASLLVGWFSGLKVQTTPHDPGKPHTVAAPNQLPDIARVKALGWAPRTGLAEGFRRTIDYYSAAALRN